MRKPMTATEVEASWKRWEAELKTMSRRWHKVTREITKGMRNRMLIILSNHGPIT
jgi:hypothetical protein